MHGLTATDQMFSVREVPWHQLGVVLDEYPDSVEDALEKAGLGWRVVQQPIFLPGEPKVTSDGVEQTFVEQEGWKANVRSDNDALLGVVSSGYQPVQNIQAFSFMDNLIGSEMFFETAGSIQGGKRVWVLCRLPGFVEIGGDQSARYVFLANSHDGSMAVTGGVTVVRIVCNNTLTAALHRAEANLQRTFKFRHTGDIGSRVYDARKVMGLTVNYTERFKALGDELAQQPMRSDRFERKVLAPLFPIDDETTKRARTIRSNTRGLILDLYRGKGEAGDTTGNAPGTKWAAYNAVAEYADWHRKVTQRTDQMRRSFEDTALKDRAFDLVVAA